MITASSIFHKQLPAETLDQLQEKHMTQAKPRATSGGWWPSFYGKKSDMKNDASKATPTNTATDVLAVAAKSEVVPTTLSRHDSVDSNKTQKTSYVQEIRFNSHLYIFIF